MSKKKVSRLVNSVPEEVWNKFAGYAKMNGITQAEFLKRLLVVYENYLKNTQIEEKERR